MCVALPQKVIKINKKNKKALVQAIGHSHWLDIGLMKEEIKVGDYLVSYQSVAIAKVDPPKKI